VLTVYRLRYLEQRLAHLRAEALDLLPGVGQAFLEGGVLDPEAVDVRPQAAHVGIAIVSQRRSEADWLRPPGTTS
jgi:hypothetical protein